MEAGLKVGIDAALVEADGFKGKTRLMLFTDEQPNVGRTDALSFMGMADKASRSGIGMTTIGVGVQYDGALAARLSSVRGGNLFFITGPGKGRDLMKADFRNMVSEVAHDLVMTLTPHPGYRVSGVFGVPDSLMREGRDGSVAVTVPTVFLSSNGGGIYATLAKADKRAQLPEAAPDASEPLMSVSLTYASALDGSKGRDSVEVGVPGTAEPTPKLRLAQTLVDQYLTMDSAIRAFHEKGDAKAAFAALDGLSTRLQSVDFADINSEIALVDTMRGKAAIFAGYAGEAPLSLRPLAVLGKWRVVALNGVDDLSRGDVVEFTDDEEFITYFKRPVRDEDEMYQSFAINEREILIDGGDLRVRYSVDGDRLRLHSRDDHVSITLKRETES
jgi:Ca-activated chloride channel family protein